MPASIVLTLLVPVSLGSRFASEREGGEREGGRERRLWREHSRIRGTGRTGEGERGGEKGGGAGGGVVVANGGGAVVARGRDN